jgi:hypothetical protein
MLSVQITTDTLHRGARKADALNDAKCNYTSLPLELTRLRAWLPFRMQFKEGGKPKKVPYNIAERRANFTDPHEWMTFEAAIRMMCRGGYDGIGIVLDERFGLVGYDADSCVVDGVISETVKRHVAMLDSYTEMSFSGTGIHVLARGQLPTSGRRNNGFEMYSNRRFFVVTGRHLAETPTRIEHRQQEIDRVHASIFGPALSGRAAVGRSKSVTQFPPITQVCGSGRREKPSLDPSDKLVLERPLRDAVARKYYQNGHGDKNPSSADFALGCKLAFYTSGDLEFLEISVPLSVQRPDGLFRPDGNRDPEVLDCKRLAVICKHPVKNPVPIQNANVQAELLRQLILERCALFVRNVLAAHKECLAVVAVRGSNVGDVGAHFCLPVLLRTDGECPPFRSCFDSDARVPTQGELIGHRKGFRINFTVASATRTCMWKEIGADLTFGQFPGKGLEVVFLTTVCERRQVILK